MNPEAIEEENTMKAAVEYGRAMRLAELYAMCYCESREPGALEVAKNDLRREIQKLEYLALKFAPCRICRHHNAPEFGPPCCDCEESPEGWSGFEPMPERAA